MSSASSSFLGFGSAFFSDFGLSFFLSSFLAG